MAGLFKVVMHSQRASETANEFINVFGYRSNLAVTDEITALKNAFVATIPPAVANVLVDATKITRVEVYNVADGVGYVDQVLVPPVSGASGGDSMPDFVAWGFRYNRVAAGKRHGFKRFGLIGEGGVENGVASPASITNLNALAAILGAPLREGLIDTWFPVILERKPTGVFPWTDHAISSVTYRNVTSQVSRKR